jgi:hypothetical protein
MAARIVESAAVVTSTRVASGPPSESTSENAVKTKFAEFTFHALRGIRA